MKVIGTISRVVEKNERAGELVDRVFLIPDDLTVFQKLDGAKRRGANEMAVTVASTKGFEIGAKAAIDSEADTIEAA